MAGPWIPRNSGGRQRGCGGENSRQAAAVQTNVGRQLNVLLSVLQTFDMPSVNYTLPVFAPTVRV